MVKGRRCVTAQAGPLLFVVCPAGGYKKSSAWIFGCLHLVNTYC